MVKADFGKGTMARRILPRVIAGISVMSFCAAPPVRCAPRRKTYRAPKPAIVPSVTADKQFSPLTTATPGR